MTAVDGAGSDRAAVTTEPGEDAGLSRLARPGSVMARTARGAGWIIVWRFANRGLGLISTLILVRLLTPADFGIVSLAMSFVQGLGQLSELGTEYAIIRADAPDRALYDTGFTINALRGLGVAIVLLILAVPLAHFFHNPHFAPVVVMAALVSLLSGLENIGVVDFRRFIAFDQEFKLKLIPRLISVATAIGLAFLWHDFWALISAILVNQAVTVGLSYWMHPYRPRFTLRAWRRIAGYSLMLWLINVVALVRSQASNVVLGRMIGAGAVGVFGVGAEIAALPTSELVGPLCRAAFSGFTELRRTADGGAAMLLRLLGLMAMFTLPAGFGLSLVADPVVRLGFGKAWLGAVPLLEILGIAGSLTIFGMISATVFSVHAWMQAMLKLNLALTFCRLLLLLVLVPRFGLIGAAIALAVTDAIDQVIYLVVTVRRLQVGLRAILARVWRTLVATAVMAASLVALHLGWTTWSGPPAALAPRLAEAVALGAAIYAATHVALWFATGRPNGAERDVLATLTHLRRT